MYALHVLCFPVCRNTQLEIGLDQIYFQQIYSVLHDIDLNPLLCCHLYPSAELLSMISSFLLEYIINKIQSFIHEQIRWMSMKLQFYKDKIGRPTRFNGLILMPVAKMVKLLVMTNGQNAGKIYSLCKQQPNNVLLLNC